MSCLNSIVYCWIIVRLEGSPPDCVAKILESFDWRPGQQDDVDEEEEEDDDNDDGKAATTIPLCTLRRNLKY